MNWFLYILQVNLYLVLLYGFYVILLQNDTFFRLNRIYLLSSGVLSFLIPILQFESIRALFITERISQTISTVVYQSAPAEVIAAESGNKLTITDWLLIIYAVGLLLFLIRFTVQLFAAHKHSKGGPDVKAHSFFQKIIVPDHIQGKEVIIKHEEAHAKQWHSLDVLFFEIIAIINWFNPVAYSFKKASKHIHEFIADEEATLKARISAEDYSSLLVSNAFGMPVQNLSSSFFNQSLLKRRIIMLHKTKSKRIALLKYGLFGPLLAAMLIFSSATVKKQTETFKNSVDQLSITPENQLQANVASKIFSKKVDLKEKLESFAQKYLSPVSEIQDDTIYAMEKLQVLPQFPGGAAAWMKFLQGYNYPAIALDNNVSGTVYVAFTVEKEGSLTNIYVLRDIGFGTGAEAVRLLKTTPKWTPGVKDGNLVRVAYTQPINLSLTLFTPEPPLFVQDEPVPMESVDVLPQFPGGPAEWGKFLQGYNYPADARENNASGTLYVGFIVEKDGTLSNIRIVRDIAFKTGEEALRLMKTSPKWAPGMQKGQHVRVAYVQPIKLSLN